MSAQPPNGMPDAPGSAPTHEPELLHDVLDGMGALVHVLDRDGVIRYINGATQRILGYAPGELVGQLAEDFVHPADRGHAARTFEQDIAGPPRSRRLELRIRHKEGSYRHFEVFGTITADRAGAPIAIVTSHDVTERSLAERTLRASEERLRSTLAQSLLQATLDSTADGILVVDRAGDIVAHNQRFVDMWRIPPERLRVGTDEVLIHAVLDQIEAPEAFLSKVRELYAEPEAVSLDVIRFKDDRIYERYSQPQRVAGEVVGRVWSFRDVTEQRQLEDQFRQAQKLDAIGRLAGGIAHDFNNLLTAIRGRVEIARAQLAAREPVVAHLDEVVEAADRAASLTKQLLAFSRRQVLPRRVVDVNAAVQGMHRLLGPVIGETVCVEVMLSEDATHVLGDPAQVEQIILNLALNARDAMPAGGRIVISTRRQGERVLLEVRDDGEGMSEETQRRMFEPFFTTKPPGKGTGLGLSTVYGIVQQMAGQIRVHSRIGAGTTFNISLPGVDARLAEAWPPSPPLGERGGSETVLIAEDERLVRSLARTVLESAGYRVLEAADGKEALAAAESHPEPIHLLVSDIVMPDMNGRQLAERLRSVRPDIRVLLMSGYPDDGGETSTESFAELLVKPFAPGDLLQRVQEVLARPAAAAP